MFPTIFVPVFDADYPRNHACAPAMLRAGIVSGGVCVFMRLSAQILENYRSEVDAT